MHDIFLMLKVLNQDETPLLYSIVFGEGVVNDATSIVLFNAVQSLDVSNIDLLTASIKIVGDLPLPLLHQYCSWYSSKLF